MASSQDEELSLIPIEFKAFSQSSIVEHVECTSQLLTWIIKHLQG